LVIRAVIKRPIKTSSEPIQRNPTHSERLHLNLNLNLDPNLNRNPTHSERSGRLRQGLPHLVLRALLLLLPQPVTLPPT
jgi:hypothetical protein